MLKNSLPLFVMVFALAVFEGTSFAQRGGGRGGGMGRGQMSGGGMMGSDGQGCIGRGNVASSGMGNAASMMGNQNRMMQTALGFMNNNNGTRSNARAMNPGSGMNGLGCQRSQNASGTGALMARRGNSPGMPQPTPQQFAQAAMKFDGNNDGLLNSEELTHVATAVWAELGQRQSRTSMTPIQASRTVQNGLPSTEQISEVFVARSLTFDSDKDGALNIAETRRMAAAFIRSLG